jgi:hypothetical protein
MMDDATDRPVSPDGGRYALLYDFFKHLTSLSALVLGGVLALYKTFTHAGAELGLVIAVLGTVSTCGVVAFHATSEIARSIYNKKEPGRSVQWAAYVAPTLLALGVGIFLSMYLGSFTH